MAAGRNFAFTIVAKPLQLATLTVGRNSYGAIEQYTCRPPMTYGFSHNARITDRRQADRHRTQGST